MNKIDKHNFLVIYKSAWGKIHTKEMRAFNLRSVVAKFDRIKPTAKPIDGPWRQSSAARIKR